VIVMIPFKKVLLILLLVLCCYQAICIALTLPNKNENSGSKKKYGFIDTTGKIVIQPIFDSVGDFSEGLIPVRIEKEWGFINKKGEIVIKPKFKDIGVFINGLSLGEIGEKEPIFGFIDKTGEWVIPPKYFYAEPFSEGLAPVIYYCDSSQDPNNTAYGYIDKSDTFIIPPQFQNAHSFYEGLALVTEDTLEYKKWLRLLRKKRFSGEPLTNEDVEFNGYPTYFRYIDKKGKVVIKAPNAYHARSFNEGLAAVELDEGWGFIDKTGKIVISTMYGGVGNFHEGICAVLLTTKRGGKMGYIDKKGNLSIPLKFADAGSFQDGIAPASLNYYLGKGEWGYIDKTGKFVIEPIYDSVGYFYDGLAWATIGKRKFYIDKTGRTVIEPQNYEIIKNFSDGLAAIAVTISDSGKIGEK
jgi:hypothetical protein